MKDLIRERMVLRMKNSMSVYPLYHNDIYVLCTYTYFAYIVKENSLLVKSLMGNQKFRDRKDCNKHKVPAVDILANFWIVRVYIYTTRTKLHFLSEQCYIYSHGSAIKNISIFTKS